MYVLLPVLGLIKKSHSRFNFFDNLAIEKTPFTHLDKGYRNAHPNWPIFQIFLWENLSPHLFEPGSEKMGGYFEKKIKSPFTCLKWETILGGCFWKNFWKIKNSSQFIEQRGDVFEKLLNCKTSYRNRSVTNQLPKFENLLILENETAKMGLSHFVSLLCFLSVSFSDCKYKKLVFANLLYWKLLFLVI